MPPNGFHRDHVGYRPDVRAREVVFEAAERIGLRTVDVAEPRDGEVLVRTALSGVSTGTELLAYLGLLDPGVPLDETLPEGRKATFRFPFSYGYSAVGVVERGNRSLQQGTEVFAFRPHVDAFVAPAQELLPIGSLDPVEATLLPLVETALQVSLEVNAPPDGRVAVVGLGLLGLLTALVLRRNGLHVVGIEPRRDRRELAGQLGIPAVTPDDASGVIDRWTSRRGVGRVVEASGAPAALAAALPLLAHEGHAVVASWYGTREVSLPLGAEFHRRRLTIRSTQVSTIPASLAPTWTVERRRQVSLDLCADLPLERIPTLVLPVDRAAEGFAVLAKRKEGGPMHLALDHR